jgi:GTP cyclohydrolase IA
MEVFYPEAIEAVKTILKYIYEDPERDGLKQTPERYLHALTEMTIGIDFNPKTILKTFENVGYDEMVVLKDIEFCSLCEHHLLPFTGIGYIAYIPNGRIVGISKLARLLEIYSRRLQVQERITVQVTKALDDFVTPKGSACVLKATHGCMSCRGIKKTISMITSSLTGVFKDDYKTRTEFFNLIGAK